MIFRWTWPLLLCALVSSASADLQSQAPRVTVPAGVRAAAPLRPQSVTQRALYPWKTYVTITVFWIGEEPTPRNPTPNFKSSWDTNWTSRFGGFDDPDPTNRVADHQSGDFRPRAFVPRLNPFYIALPYNDVVNHRAHKPEASRVIPWFGRMNPMPGKTVLKGRWLQIYNGKRSCYAQWEDCGPWVTDDWQYVFGDKPPKTKQNGAAGLDISPAVRDYLSLRSGQKVHWRFVEDSQVPYGPWKRYGQDAPPTPASALAYQPRRAAQPGAQITPPTTAASEAEQRYLEYLRRLRDQEFQTRKD